MRENAAKMTAELSGAQWVRRFPGSSSLRDLRAPFRDQADAFVSALRSAGATVSIAATYRPPRRAYLMHWVWRIVKRDLEPASGPSMDGVDINWMHDGADETYSRAASLAAARQMVLCLGIQSLGVAPALQSRPVQTYGVIKYNRAGRDAPHWSDNGA